MRAIDEIGKLEVIVTRLRAENERLRRVCAVDPSEMVDGYMKLKRQRDALLEAARPRRCDHADNVYCMTCLIELRHRLDAAIDACE